MKLITSLIIGISCLLSSTIQAAEQQFLRVALKRSQSNFLANSLLPTEVKVGQTKAHLIGISLLKPASPTTGRCLALISSESSPVSWQFTTSNSFDEGVTTAKNMGLNGAAVVELDLKIDKFSVTGQVRNAAPIGNGGLSPAAGSNLFSVSGENQEISRGGNKIPCGINGLFLDDGLFLQWSPKSKPLDAVAEDALSLSSRTSPVIPFAVSLSSDWVNAVMEKLFGGKDFPVGKNGDNIFARDIKINVGAEGLVFKARLRQNDLQADVQLTCSGDDLQYSGFKVDAVLKDCGQLSGAAAIKCQLENTKRKAAAQAVQALMETKYKGGSFRPVAASESIPFVVQGRKFSFSVETSKVFTDKNSVLLIGVPRITSSN